jgi:hypothetical protein
MLINSTTRFAALAALAGALACASNKARTDDTTQPSQAAAARDTTTTDTLNQNPAGYRGMERDTTMAPEHQQTPTDTFLQRQGTGAPQDTAGYSGMERVDTTGQAGQNQQANPPSEVSPYDTTGAAAGAGQDTSGMSSQDTSGMRQDTSGMSGMDTTSMQRDTTGTTGYQNNSGTGLDSTGMSRTGDTTGYNQSQDTTTSR